MGQVTNTVQRRPATQLRDYQTKGAQRIAAGESCSFWWEVGGGKTTMTAHGIVWRLKDSGLVVLVSTGAVIGATWAPELDAWQDTAVIGYHLITGTPAQRTDKLRKAIKASKDHVVIAAITFDIAQWALELLKPVHVDMLVIDEASLARNVKSKRFKNLIQLAAKVDQRITLSGSPSPNHIGDTFGLIALTDLGKALGTSLTRFNSNFMVKTGPKAWHITERKGARGEVLEKIKHLVSVVRTADVVSGMPTMMRTVVEVVLPDSAMQMYNEAETGLLKEDKLHQDAILVKLQQIANGRVLHDGQVQIVHNAKIDAANDLIEALVDSGQQVIVIYQFTADADALLARWGDKALLFKTAQAAQCVAQWNQGLPVMLLHGKAGGHGLNLQHAPNGGHMLWLQASWSAEMTEQCTGRIYRPGQKRPCRVTVIAARDTIDAAIIKTLSRKTDAQSAVKLYLAERRANAYGNTNLADQIAQARRNLAAAHPDHGGSPEQFRQAWATFEALRNSV